MKASEIAKKASDLVGGDREETHGDKLKNFANVAAMWNAVLKCAGKLPANELNALDVANMMEAMKIARRYTGSHNIDDYVDGAGYAACGGQIADEIEENRKSWVKAA